MVDDGRAGLDHLGRLVLTGVGMGALVGATTSVAVALAGGAAGSGYLQGYLLAGAGMGMVVGVVVGAGIAVLALGVLRRRARSAAGVEAVTVFAAVALTTVVVVIACLWLGATAVATLAAVVVGSIEVVLVLWLTRRWRQAALGR